MIISIEQIIIILIIKSCPELTIIQSPEQIITERSTIRWLIGIAVTVIVAVGSFLMLPYRIARNNEKDITIIKTTIEKSLAPSIEKNSNAIETINVEIKEYLNNNSNKKTNTQKKSNSCPSTK